MITSGGPRNSTPGTLNQLFFNAVQRYDRPDALQVKVTKRLSHGLQLGEDGADEHLRFCA